MTLPFLPHSEFTHNEISEVEAAVTQKDTVYGDVNSDGKITILDMIALKSYLTEKNEKGFSLKAADLDEDGEVSAKDAVELSMYLLNSIGSFSNELNIDTDGDGLSDYVEKEILKTDHTKKDTDGDGLDDYSEVYFCDTDPLLTDTGETGTKDSLKDADGDKFTNSEEIKLGTSPALADTDEDGLGDYDEVIKYKTDPLKDDTDGDGLCDGSEVALGLDPLKDTTDNIKDTERVFNKSFKSTSSVFENVNTEDSSYKITLDIKATGDIEKNLSVTISKYSEFLSSDFIEGEIIDINYNSLFEIKEKTISFEITDEKLYWIFKYYPDSNMLLPVETEYDNGKAYFKDTGVGTYCIVKYNQWLADMDQSDNVIPVDRATQGYSYEIIDNSDVYDYGKVGSSINNKIDLYFVIFTTNEYKDTVREDIISASKAVLTNAHKNGNDDVRLYYITYLGTAVPVIGKDKYYIDYSDYEENSEIVDNMISRSGALNINISNENYAFFNTFIEIDSSVLSVNKNPDGKPNPFVYVDEAVISKFNYNKIDDAVDSFSEIVNLSENRSRNKYCIVVDYGFEPVLNYGKNSVQTAYEMIGNFKENNNVDFTFITNSGNKNYEYYDSMDSGKKYYYWTYNTVEQIVSEIVIPEQFGFTVDTNTGALKKSIFKKLPDLNCFKAANGNYTAEQLKEMLLADSDNDGLYDFEEIDWSLVKIDSEGNLIFPTLEDICQLYPETRKVLTKFKSMNKTVVIPLKSDPNSKDTDNDGLFDSEARYVWADNGSGNYEYIKVAPKDPDPVGANAPAGIWDEHVRQIKEGTRMTHTLTGHDLYDGFNTAFGSFGLDFLMDEKEIAIHSKEKQWQKYAGFNDGYDVVFRTFTNDNMDRLKIPYKAKYSGDGEEKEHILWLWRGDYLNIGTGGEIGIYNEPTEVALITRGIQWFVPKYRFDMTLEIYNYHGEKDIQNVVCWHPYEKQWWITGFNPEMRETAKTGFGDPNVHDTILVGSIDFAEEIDMYNSIKESTFPDSDWYDFVTFDDESNKLWIVWWDINFATFKR
ncbi:dockerin type I repeat-containing protein [Ruminococcus sp. HUN007]|uniref:dockerin type I repeat-containing protein n=1 Tax=Ruminococcus sp. HUN007 TaxID=1514668 RepID=UPI0006784A48|nr:dockerin type I repeat-containing protein [Ruminococcus sp. HUN007]